MCIARSGSTIFVCGSRRVQGVCPQVSFFPNCAAEPACRDEALEQLAISVSSLRMDKSFIGWGLEELEKQAQEDLERSSDSDDESEDEVESMLPAPL